MTKSIVPILTLGMAGGGSPPTPAAAPPVSQQVADVPTPANPAQNVQKTAGIVAAASAGGVTPSLLQQKRKNFSTAATRLLGS